MANENDKKKFETPSEPKKYQKYTTPPEILEKSGEIKHHTDEDFVDDESWYKEEKLEKND